ncbi:MAG: nucleoside triphosphate pyrophosphohydrolase [Actinomycetia bacterium]|nr:nucleoside triphosphate pyrophosphohydrolase [Actinomycetes bacterium]MCH9762104.1 nucleoside triphosphate pyrophosphohydrolase [Actinomycetes bacterium]
MSDTAGKLVRDGIPAIIAASGRTANVKRLDGSDYHAALLDKLDEETAELRQATAPAAVLEEAADVLEVLIGIVGEHGHNLDALLRSAEIKRAERGGFTERLWLLSRHA